MIVYISGKITGEPWAKVVEKFASAELKLKNQGYQPVNPLNMDYHNQVLGSST